MINDTEVFGDSEKTNFNGVMEVKPAWSGVKWNRRKVIGDSKHRLLFLEILLQMERKRNGAVANKGLKRGIVIIIFKMGEI